MGLALVVLLAPAPAFTQTPEAAIELRQAIKKGDLASVERLLKKLRPELNKIDKYEHDAFLHLAAEHGHLPIVKYLVEQGADVNLRSAGRIPFIGGINRYGNGGQTPLLLATAEGHVEVARYLLAQGAKADVADQWGWTPLHHTARQGHADLMATLFKQGAKLSREDKDDRKLGRFFGGPQMIATPLHLAAEGGHDAVIKLLLEHKAEVNARDSALRTPLHRLLDDLDYSRYIKVRYYTDMNPIEYTVAKASPQKWQEPGRVRALKLLLAAKADPSAQDDEWRTPLLLAHRFARETKLYTLLKESGASYSAADAVRVNDAKLLEQFLQANPKLLQESFVHRPNQRSESVFETQAAGWKVDRLNLFLLAIAEGHQSIVELLLRHKADVESAKMNPRLLTPLAAATFFQQAHLVRLFVDKADKSEFSDFLSVFWLTAERCRAGEGKVEVLRPLLRRRADIDDQRYLQAVSNSVVWARERKVNHALLELLLEHKGKIDMKDEKIFAAVEQAVRWRDRKAVALLVKHGARVDRKQEDGQSPLHEAAFMGDAALVRLLLEAKPNLEARDRDQATALHYAVRLSSNQEVVRLLVEAGADVFARDKHGRTPSMAANNEAARTYLREQEAKRMKEAPKEEKRPENR
jgi:ankyrin repeat protein